MSKRPSKIDRHAPVTETGNGDAFLSRWARRKRVARSGGDPDATRPESSAPRETLARANPDTANTPSESEVGEERELTDEDMPPLESIDENTDMSGFFSSKVSREVKKAALRKFFHSPAFNIVDGLDDYDDDFRSFASLGDIITSDMRSQMERKAEQARQRLAADAEAGGVPASSQPPAEQPVEIETPTDSDGEDDARPQPQQTARQQTGVIRDPARTAGPGKLRPKDSGGDDA